MHSKMDRTLMNTLLPDADENIRVAVTGKRGRGRLPGEYAQRVQVLTDIHRMEHTMQQLSGMITSGIGGLVETVAEVVDERDRLRNYVIKVKPLLEELMHFHKTVDDMQMEFPTCVICMERVVNPLCAETTWLSTCGHSICLMCAGHASVSRTEAVDVPRVKCPLCNTAKERVKIYL